MKNLEGIGFAVRKSDNVDALFFGGIFLIKSNAYDRNAVLTGITVCTRLTVCAVCAVKNLEGIGFAVRKSDNIDTNFLSRVCFIKSNAYDRYAILTVFAVNTLSLNAGVLGTDPPVTVKNMRLLSANRYVVREINVLCTATGKCDVISTCRKITYKHIVCKSNIIGCINIGKLNELLGSVVVHKLVAGDVNYLSATK